jgi:hypothetical protein
MPDDEYKITKDDILAMLRYLRINLPMYATPENAIKILDQDSRYYKNLEEIDPKEIEKILQDLEDR